MQLVWLLPLLGAIVGAITIGLTMAGATSAPQEAAGYAAACAFAIVPYVFAKAVQGMGGTTREEEASRIIAAIKAQNNPNT